MTNPLLQATELPPFSAIQPEHVVPAIEQLLANAEVRLDTVTRADQVSWDAVPQQLDNLLEAIEFAWTPVQHLNGVMNSDALRQAYEACLPKLSEFYTRMTQDETLFQQFEALAASAEFSHLSEERRAAVEHALRDFRLSGVALPADKKARFADINKRLSELANQFSNNVLDATQGWTKLITDADELSGLPDNALQLAKQAAEQKGENGYLLTLEFPSYHPVMAYCDNRELRHSLYQAFATRASDAGPHAGRWDNSTLMEEILALRHEQAQLLGFDHYADYSLAAKMADSSAEVIGFLRDLAAKSKPMAEQELAELRAFAQREYGVEQLEAWDITYYSEKLRMHQYAISQEALRPYFPAPVVIDGMFEVVSRLFGIRIRANTEVDLYHTDVTFYDILRDDQVIAHFYLDPYARNNKRGGAWMADCRTRRRLDDGSLQLPVAFLTCNFTPSVGGKPALLTHNEVTTLFHEFGHGLHHMLTQVETKSVSGISGVEWDAVELPSQFLENWCWQPEALALISSHHETGETLPKDLLDKMLAAKNFQSGMMMMRQLEFALFDFRLHAEYDPATPRSPQAILDEVRDEVAVFRPPEYNRFQHSFSHIFAGGYAAGYYSYKWAEVLSADAFSLFEETGVFNADTGQQFLQNILEKGASQPAKTLFEQFRGREPSPEALLRHSGISEAA